jgi:phosphatidylserine/phosphatidylglycerophosphate/cardiolipin synthase-like enzyme
MLWLVLEFARTHGHEARILKSCSRTLNGERVATFIHAKVFIVDDRFLCVGSANLMNRSMRVDHELNLSFDAALLTREDAAELSRDIQAIRCSLLAEHAGIEDCTRFENPHALVSTVDELCNDLFSKLQQQAVTPPTADDPIRATVFDPNGPIDWENLGHALEESFSQSELPAQDTARKIGQRLGVVDVPQESA